jgi:hypothetical protein
MGSSNGARLIFKRIKGFNQIFHTGEAGALPVIIPNKILLGFEEVGGVTASVSIKCTNERNVSKYSKTVFLGRNQHLWITC